MQYKITRYTRGTDLIVSEFDEIEKAYTFIKKQLQSDKNLNIESTYRILDFDEVIKEYNTKDLPDSEDDSGSSSSSSRGAGFKPTPFNTAPRPVGTMPNWTTNGEEETNEK